ncbi:hypothetical protein I7I48_01597 [Histoplasma ohiense]|nr:hypothetical protein I7I48_01597 [Histoplasma ohiense (nom. inval.)]
MSSIPLHLHHWNIDRDSHVGKDLASSIQHSYASIHSVILANPTSRITLSHRPSRIVRNMGPVPRIREYPFPNTICFVFQSSDDGRSLFLHWGGHVDIARGNMNCKFSF